MASQTTRSAKQTMKQLRLETRLRELLHHSSMHISSINHSQPRLSPIFQLQPRQLLQLHHRLIRPPQLHLNSPHPQPPRRLQILPNIVQKRDITRPHPHTQPFRLDILMQPRDRVFVDILERFAHPDVCAADEDVEGAAQGGVLLACGRRGVAEGVVGWEDGCVAQSAEDQLPVALIRCCAQTLQRRPHVWIWFSRYLHHAPV